jgi:hypothetical protein
MIEFYKFAAVDVAAGKKGGFLSVFIALRQEQNPTNSALLLSFRVQENLFFAVTK